ncbi:uncharacterized protein EAE97_010489 [Botrytis byssoidea]|uniref:Mediator of RNA polymerase II transcription subunit 8 n=1 Tax=Botrytis byssoidea TaxID=139641 RepID=A0A9P5HWG5_9HELO|nr:uncharacterized protein EAE97_010489 [Botrytis byssoidea]KAF7925408.1 hypothetical protein EAE97_010489 [Botrytis byssoidea]
MALQQEDIKALEQTRQRLLHLTANIASLKADFQRGAPLPEYSSIMTSSSILSTNIQSVTDHLAGNSELLSRIVAFPSTNFPGRTQEGLLLQLLRKKLEPQVETWVDEGRNLQIDVAGGGENIEETWKWASDWIGPRIREYALNEATDEYTWEERASGDVDNVNTGLKDEEDSDDDDEDEDEDDDDEVMGGMGKRFEKKKAKAPEKGVARKDGRVRTKEEILRFATSGVI